MTEKEKFIKWVEVYLPDDIQTYISETNNYDCIDVKIFTKPKDEKFIDWYFAP